MYRSKSRKTFKFEALESRRLLDGNISTSKSDNNHTLTLMGDLGDNAVAVISTSTNVIEVIGLNTFVTGETTPFPTTINGHASQIFSNITRLVFNFNEGQTGINTGNDQIVLTDLTLTGKVTIHSGDGNNFFGIGDFNNADNTVDLTDSPVTITPSAVSFGHGLVMTMGGGTDAVRANDVTLGGTATKNLTITGGEGDSTLTFDNTTVTHQASFTDGAQLALTLNNFTAGSLTDKDGSGNDSINITGDSTITHAITMNTGIGNDFVNFTGLHAGSVDLLLGAGADQFTGDNDVITNSSIINGGADNDTVTLDNYTTGSLEVDIGLGANTVSLTEVTVTNAAKIVGDDGTAANSITVDTLTAKSFSMTGGAGDDTISLDGVTVTKAATIDTGAGSDNLTFDGFSSKSLRVTMDSGADTVSVENVTVTDKAFFGGGSGDDTFTNVSGNTFGTLTKSNFETGG
jgi:hypothetical protein